MAQIRAQHIPSDCALYCSLNDFPRLSSGYWLFGSSIMGISTGPGALTSFHARDSFFPSIDDAFRINIAVTILIQLCCYHSHPSVAIDFTPNTRLVSLKMCCYSTISQKDKSHSGILM